MGKIYLPMIQGDGRLPTVPLGYALYDLPHTVSHEQMDAGKPLLNWTALACCLEYPSYLPMQHSTFKCLEGNDLSALAEKFPRRTWLLLNEPDLPPPQAFIRPDYALEMVRRWIKLLKPHGHRVAGYGVTITAPVHWTSTYAARYPNAWNTIGWRKWLDDWNKLRGPVPDVAHVHIYAKTKKAWQDQYQLWREWNRVNWQVPTIITECGESLEVWNYLHEEFIDNQVEALLWFTNFTDNPLSGLPDAP